MLLPSSYITRLVRQAISSIPSLELIGLYGCPFSDASQQESFVQELNAREFPVREFICYIESSTPDFPSGDFPLARLSKLAWCIDPKEHHVTHWTSNIFPAMLSVLSASQLTLQSITLAVLGPGIEGLFSLDFHNLLSLTFQEVILDGPHRDPNYLSMFQADLMAFLLRHTGLQELHINDDHGSKYDWTPLSLHPHSLPTLTVFHGPWRLFARFLQNRLKCLTGSLRTVDIFSLPIRESRNVMRPEPISPNSISLIEFQALLDSWGLLSGDAIESLCLSFLDTPIKSFRMSTSDLAIFLRRFKVLRQLTLWYWDLDHGIIKEDDEIPLMCDWNSTMKSCIEAYCQDLAKRLPALGEIILRGGDNDIRVIVERKPSAEGSKIRIYLYNSYVPCKVYV